MPEQGLLNRAPLVDPATGEAIDLSVAAANPAFPTASLMRMMRAEGTLVADIDPEDTAFQGILSAEINSWETDAVALYTEYEQQTGQTLEQIRASLRYPLIQRIQWRWLADKGNALEQHVIDDVLSKLDAQQRFELKAESDPIRRAWLRGQHAYNIHQAILASDESLFKQYKANAQTTFARPQSFTEFMSENMTDPEVLVRKYREESRQANLSRRLALRIRGRRPRIDKWDLIDLTARRELPAKRHSIIPREFSETILGPTAQPEVESFLRDLPGGVYKWVEDVGLPELRGYVERGPIPLVPLAGIILPGVSSIVGEQGVDHPDSRVGQLLRNFYDYKRNLLAASSLNPAEAQRARQQAALMNIDPADANLMTDLGYTEGERMELMRRASVDFWDGVGVSEPYVNEIIFPIVSFTAEAGIEDPTFFFEMLGLTGTAAVRGGRRLSMMAWARKNAARLPKASATATMLQHLPKRESRGLLKKMRNYSRAIKQGPPYREPVASVISFAQRTLEDRTLRLHELFRERDVLSRLSRAERKRMLVRDPTTGTWHPNIHRGVPAQFEGVPIGHLTVDAVDQEIRTVKDMIKADRESLAALKRGDKLEASYQMAFDALSRHLDNVDLARAIARDPHVRPEIASRVTRKVANHSAMADRAFELAEQYARSGRHVDLLSLIDDTLGEAMSLATREKPHTFPLRTPGGEQAIRGMYNAWGKLSRSVVENVARTLNPVGGGVSDWIRRHFGGRMLDYDTQHELASVIRKLRGKNTADRLLVEQMRDMWQTKALTRKQMDEVWSAYIRDAKRNPLSVIGSLPEAMRRRRQIKAGLMEPRGEAFFDSQVLGSGTLPLDDVDPEFVSRAVARGELSRDTADAFMRARQMHAVRDAIMNTMDDMVQRGMLMEDVFFLEYGRHRMRYMTPKQQAKIRRMGLHSSIQLEDNVFVKRDAHKVLYDDPITGDAHEVIGKPIESEYELYHIYDEETKRTREIPREEVWRARRTVDSAADEKGVRLTDKQRQEQIRAQLARQLGIDEGAVGGRAARDDPLRALCEDKGWVIEGYKSGVPQIRMGYVVDYYDPRQLEGAVAVARRHGDIGPTESLTRAVVDRVKRTRKIFKTQDEAQQFIDSLGVGHEDVVADLRGLGRRLTRAPEAYYAKDVVLPTHTRWWGEKVGPGAELQQLLINRMNINRFDAAEAMANNPKMAIDISEDELAKRLAAGDPDYQQYAGWVRVDESFGNVGKLQGMLVHPKVASTLVEIPSIFGRTADAVMSFWEELTIRPRRRKLTVMTGATHGTNLMGNVLFFSLAADNWALNPRNWRDHYIPMLRQSLRIGSKQFLDDMDAFVNSGIKSGAIDQEISVLDLGDKESMNLIRQAADGKITPTRFVGRAMLRYQQLTALGLYDKARRLYRFVDILPRKALVHKAYTKWGMSPEEASRHANMWFPSLPVTQTFWTRMSRPPGSWILGPFAHFIGEATRVMTKMAVEQAPKLLAAMGGITTGIIGLNAIRGFSPDEVELANTASTRGTPVGPLFGGGQALILNRTEDNELLTWSLVNDNPYFLALPGMYEALFNPRGQKGVLGRVFSQLQSDPAVQMFESVLRNRDPETGRAVYDPRASASVQLQQVYSKFHDLYGFPWPARIGDTHFADRNTQQLQRTAANWIKRMRYGPDTPQAQGYGTKRTVGWGEALLEALLGVRRVTPDSLARTVVYQMRREYTPFEDTFGKNYGREQMDEFLREGDLAGAYRRGVQLGVSPSQIEAAFRKRYPTVLLRDIMVRPARGHAMDRILVEPEAQSMVGMRSLPLEGQIRALAWLGRILPRRDLYEAHYKHWYTRGINYTDAVRVGSAQLDKNVIISWFQARNHPEIMEIMERLDVDRREVGKRWTGNVVNQIVPLQEEFIALRDAMANYDAMRQSLPFSRKMADAYQKLLNRFDVDADPLSIFNRDDIDWVPRRATEFEEGLQRIGADREWFHQR